MNNTKEKQLGALGLCAFSVPGILFLPQTGWEAVLLVTLGSLLIVTFGRPMVDGSPTRTEKGLGILLFAWNIVIMGKIGWDLSNFQGVESALPGLLLLLLGAYAAKKKVVIVVAAVLMFFIVGIYGVLYLFAVPNVEFENLIPDRQWNLQGLVYGFLPILLLYMYKDGGRKQRLYWMTGSLILAVGAAIITEGLGAPDFYTASMTVNLLGAMERLEPFVAAAAIAGGFCLLGMLFCVNEKIWKNIWQQKKNFPIEWLLLLGGVGILVSSKIENEIYDFGTTVCWGLLPILTQLVVSQKNIEKKSKKLKKTLDKWEDIC